MPQNIFFAQETIKRGSPFPQGQEVIIDYDPQRGFHYQTRYDGISQTQLESLQQSIIAQGIACRLRLFKDVGTLDVDDSTSEYTIDSWEVPGSDVSVDGLSHPTVLGIFGPSGTGYWWAKIRQALEDNESPDDFYADMIGDLDNFLTDQQATTIIEFYNLQQAGQKEFKQPAYTLRHKTNVSNRWAANVADVGIATIYTPAQLLTEVTDSGLWIYPLPPRLQFKIAAIPAQPPQINFLWGWFKTTSTESNTANNRVDITTEYILSLASLAYYTAFDGNYGNVPYY